MVEERALEKLFALEMARFHKSFVAQPRPLADLIAESEPSATTRSGETHHYDRATIQRLHDALGPLARRRLRLPVTFYVDKELSDDAHVTDETAIEALRALGEIAADAEPRDGKLWIGHTRARLIASRNPGAFQFVYF